MFLRQADGRKSPLPNHGAQTSGQATTINSGSTVGNQFPRFSPAPIHESSPMSRTAAPPRAIFYALRFRFAPIEHERPARKPSRHTCGKLHECLSFYYLSTNCAAPLKYTPKLMSSCTSPNRQPIFRQNASAETFRNNIVRSPANAITLHSGMQNAYGNHFAPLRASGCAQLLASTSMGAACIQSVILRSRAHRNQEVIRPRRALSKWPRCLLL